VGGVENHTAIPTKGPKNRQSLPNTFKPKAIVLVFRHSLFKCLLYLSLCAQICVIVVVLEPVVLAVLSGLCVLGISVVIVRFLAKQHLRTVHQYRSWRLGDKSAIISQQKMRKCSNGSEPQTEIETELHKVILANSDLKQKISCVFIIDCHFSNNRKNTKKTHIEVVSTVIVK
jgi:hypothetical protein